MILLLVILVMFGIVIYFIPSLIARNRNSIKKDRVYLLNIFAGWCVIGWIVALIWAIDSERKKEETKTIKL